LAQAQVLAAIAARLEAPSSKMGPGDRLSGIGLQPLVRDARPPCRHGLARAVDWGLQRARPEVDASRAQSKQGMKAASAVAATASALVASCIRSHAGCSSSTRRRPAVLCGTTRVLTPKRARPNLVLGAAPGKQSSVFSKGMLVVLFVSCLNLLGYTVLAPLTPGMVSHFALQSEASIGLMASAFGVGRLCAASVWPALSDIFGTRHVLIVALFGSMSGILWQAVAILLDARFSVFLVARVLTGIFSGIVPVVKAYIVRSFPKEDVPRALAYREAAGTVAFVLGPVVGGACAKRHLSLPLFLAAGATGSAALCVARYLQEPQAAKAAKKAKMRSAVAVGSSSSKWAAIENVLPALMLSFAWASTRTCFHTYYPWMLAKQQMTTVQIGSTLTTLSLFMCMVQLLAFPVCVERMGVRGTLFTGGVLISVGLLGLSAGTVPAFLAFSTIYGLGGALMSPAAPALLVRLVPEDVCGTLLGVDSAVTNFGRIVAPLVFGMWYGGGALHAAAACMVLASIPAALVGLGWRGWFSSKMRRLFLVATGRTGSDQA